MEDLLFFIIQTIFVLLPGIILTLYFSLFVHPLRKMAELRIYLDDLRHLWNERPGVCSEDRPYTNQIISLIEKKPASIIFALCRLNEHAYQYDTMQSHEVAIVTHQFPVFFAALCLRYRFFFLNVSDFRMWIGAALIAIGPYLFRNCGGNYKKLKESIFWLHKTTKSEKGRLVDAAGFFDCYRAVFEKYIIIQRVNFLLSVIVPGLLVLSIP